MKALNVISSAYRATLEEQDDPIVWITHAMKGAGADLNVLLRGNAVNYVVKGQDASGLSFGGKAQTQPPDLPRDIEGLVVKGVDVFVIEEDINERGLGNESLVEGIRRIPRAEVPKLLSNYDQVWPW